MANTAIVGDSDIRPGYNATGNPLPYGTVVILTAGIENQIALPGGATAAVYGVVCDAAGIANLATGNIQISGRAQVLAGAGVTACVRVAPDNTGRVQNAAATNSVVGIALHAQATVGAQVTVELSGPGGAAMAT